MLNAQGDAVIQNKLTLQLSFPVVFTDNFLTHPLFLKLSQAPEKKIVLFDQGLLNAWPQLPFQMEEALGRYVPWESLPGGEACKEGLGSLERVLNLLETHRLPKGSMVFAFGGGSFLDVVGLAASMFHRGLKLIRFPTTVLAQNDAGIGVKNGINLYRQKNFIGTFKAPHAVINDHRFLRTLDKRDLRSGMAEAVKVSLLKDAAFFEWMESQVEALAEFEPRAMAQLIRRCAQLHLEQITQGGDPFEENGARPLDFGHWLAHRLEVLSQHSLRHGEAVATGIVVDSAYSHLLHGLSIEECVRIQRLLNGMGFQFDIPFAIEDLLQGLLDFKNHLGGEFQLSVLNSIGKSLSTSVINLEAFKKILSRLSAGPSREPELHG